MQARILRLESDNYRLRAENKRLKQIVSSEANAMAGELIDAEQRLLQSSEDLRSVLDHMPSMIGYWDKDLRNRFVNQAYATWFGVDPAQLPGKHIREVIGEARYKQNLPYIEAALRGEHQEFERAIPSPDGTQLRHSLAEYIPNIVAGEVMGFYAHVTDVTRIKEAEYFLREAQEVGGVGSFRLDIATDRWISSKMMDDIFGIAADYVRSVGGWLQRVHPDERDEMLAYWQKTATHKTRFDRDYRIVRANDGAVRWVHGRGEIVCNEQGEPVQLIGSIQDITERKLRDENLLETMAAIRLREQALSQISQGVLISGADRLTTYVNDEFTRITGYSREEMLGKPCGVLQGPDSQPEVVLQMRAALNAKQPFYGEILNYRKDGTPFWNELSMNPVFDEAGDLTQFVGVLRDVTERKQTLEDLKLFKKCINHANDVIVITEAEPFELPGPRILFVNDAYERTTGYTRQEAIGGTPRMLQGPKTDPATIKRMGQALRQWQPVREEVLNYTKDGREFWSEIDIVPMANEAGWYTHWISIQRDISERKSAEQAQRIAAIAFETQQGMFITDASNIILQVNKAFTEITGYTAGEAAGKTPQLLRSGQHGAAFYAAMWDSINLTGVWQGEIWNRRKNGTVYPQQLSISMVKDAAGSVTHYVAAFQDLTSSKAADDQIYALAFSDLLTGLPNRRFLIVRLQQAMVPSAKARQSALLQIDLDNFKTLNEALGHENGDLILQQVAKRLSACIRVGDMVARLGGDEFVVLLENLSAHPGEAVAQTTAVAQQILAALKPAYPLRGAEHRCSASIGITLFGGAQAEDTGEPLTRAELAMYQAKAAGRDTFCFFAMQMQTLVSTRAALEVELHDALLKDELVLHYQPQMTSEFQITGAEALLRWRHPQRGLVSPGEFIPLAEETGLILPIGRWALEAACKQLALWANKPGTGHLTVAVNVSARQFHQSGFVDQVLALLAQTGARANRLKLELTESALIADVEGVIVKMNALKAKGVGFALDDFGTGYSSLAYLKRLPLEKLKIDQGFVRDILTDANDVAIAKMVIALANSMGLRVLAEGVETEAQREFLAGLGCHNYQGYLFSQPLPVVEFEAFVARV